MSTEIHSGKSALLRFLAAVFVAVGGLAYVGAAAAAGPVPYTAKAVLCYVDNLGEQELGKAWTVTESKRVFRIISISDDSELLNGWEYLDDNFAQHKSGKIKNWGDLEMYPDDAYEVGLGYTGNFEEKYNLKDEVIAGVYTGTGDLNNVTVTYTVTDVVFGEEAEPCPADPPLPAHLCGTEYVCGPAPGLNLMLEGEIEGY